MKTLIILITFPTLICDCDNSVLNPDIATEKSIQRQEESLAQFAKSLDRIAKAQEAAR